MAAGHHDPTPCTRWPGANIVYFALGRTGPAVVPYPAQPLYVMPDPGLASPHIEATPGAKVLLVVHRVDL